MREPHNVQDQYAVTEKNGNHHRTFIMKVVKSVFTLFATSGHDILYSSRYFRTIN